MALFPPSIALALPRAARNPVPAQAGIGIKAQHFQDIVERGPQGIRDIGWFEAHPENYFGDGGPALAWLERIRRDYPLSLHGVGLSLGSAGPLDENHLARWQNLHSRIEPALASEHLSWSIADGDYLNDLISLPYTEEALAVFCDHVETMQETLKRRVLIENPSAYMRYAHSVIPETEFLLAVVQRTGAGVLLDVNNVFVSAHNLGIDPYAYIDAIPGHVIEEIHLAGHFDADVGEEVLKIDDHGSPVREAVWDLYAHAIHRFGPKPTLIEWDSDVPELDVLLEEARRANAILTSSKMEARHAHAG